MFDISAEVALQKYLHDPLSIRSSCDKIFSHAQNNTLIHFDYHPNELVKVVGFVAGIQSTGMHGRLEHLVAGGVNRYRSMLEERPLAQIVELVIVSTLLDAGAGPNWKYSDATSNQVLTASEGMAAATYNMYMDGMFSGSDQLKSITEQTLGAALQASADNPIDGLNHRVAILHKIAAAIESKNKYFANENLTDILQYWHKHAFDNKLSMVDLYNSLLDAFELSDVGAHQLVKTTDNPKGLIPFQKPTQWLAYSLVEPLSMCGLEVTDVNILTGLPEYRNAGLFVDFGVITPKDPNAHEKIYAIDDEFVVEWRALTVALLDQVAAALDTPMFQLLQRTWIAGRNVAKDLRPDGAAPFKLVWNF